MPRRSHASARRSAAPRRCRSIRSPWQLAVLGAAQNEQLVDHRRETVDLGGPGVELGGDARVTPAARASSRRSRSRSAGCAADVRRRRRIRAGRRSAAATRSAISLKEVLSERCSELPSTTARADRSPPASRLAAPSRRLSGSATCRAITPACEQAEQQHGAGDERELGHGAAHGVLHRGDALGDAHRADGASTLQHRHRGGEDVLAEAVAGALGLHGPSAQRGGDLRSTGVARSSVDGPALSATTSPRALTIKHAPRTDAALERTSASSSVALGGRSRSAEVGRDDVGLTERLGVDLGVDAIAQAERERYAE